jgi:hypothetical protein
MEEAAREILRSSLTASSPAKANLAKTIRRRFASFGGVGFGVAATRRHASGPRIRRMIILDTNVLSELMRSEPSPSVLAWVARQPARELCTTSITEAEILYEIELLIKSKRRDGLLEAAEAMLAVDLAARIFGSRAMQREFFLRLPLTGGQSADLSETRMRRSPPSPKC